MVRVGDEEEGGGEGKLTDRVSEYIHDQEEREHEDEMHEFLSNGAQYPFDDICERCGMLEGEGEHIGVKHSLEVPIPYGLIPKNLVLDPASRGATLEHALLPIKLFDYAEDVLDLIFRGAVLLYVAEAGTFAECLDTSMIWWTG